ncbi:type II toxin-antitoxin system Phd/YefM family antitoxin [Azospirillum sp. sgz302134]
MKSFSSRELRENIRMIEDAARAEPIAIDDDGNESFVMMSMAEYRRLKSRDRRAHAVEDLPDDIVEQVARTDMDPRHAHLDRLMDG